MNVPTAHGTSFKPASPKAIDKVTLGILSHYFRAAAEAMGYTLERTAYTTFIKESQDFATGLVSPTGEHFAFSLAIGTQNMVGIDCSTVINALAPWEEGDIGVVNCPYLSEGMVTHLPDYHLLKPIFVDGELFGFAWAFIHSTDMGGMVAGSIQPSAYELFQEGLRIPPVKLFRRGVLQTDVRAFLLANVRIPDQNWGDLNAVAAALGIAERRVHRAAGKWSLDVLKAGREALIDYAETRARSLLSRIPTGAYEFHDYLEDDVVSDMPVRVKLRLTKDTENNIHLDFTGSDGQLGSAFNIPTGGKRHPFLCMGLLSYLRSMDRAIPVNAGLLRPLTITAPEGTVVNCSFPAAVGIRFALAQMIYGVVQGILAQALPGDIPAVGAGQCTILALSLLDGRTGKRKLTVVQPMSGGSGGRPDRDGVEGCDFSLGGLANTPTEAIENEVPIIIRKYSIIPDSGGPGRFRGGLAIQLDFQVFQADSIVTARGMDRFRFQPWGLALGHAGMTGDSTVNPGAENERHVGKIDVLRLEAGDTYSVRTPGGGGYGDPLTRSPDLVLADIRNQVVSAARAADDCGVVIQDGCVDYPATEALRKNLREQRTSNGTIPAAAMFDFGAERLAHEELFSDDVADMLASLTYTLPPGLRYLAKARMFACLRQFHALNGAVAPEALAEIWTSVLRDMGLPGSASQGAVLSGVH